MLSVTFVEFFKILCFHAVLICQFINEVIKMFDNRQQRMDCEYVKSYCIFEIYIYELP